ncbi:hypothetical protein B0J18DRAFT_442931 [Chaetomium sp. MPI-SDFR-AT-0129]|uniref:Zn(2)-C6 fungal-type domain-containing protein n=1 Tax=Dichotomopilus funicola TaxID=1934379 RepID=A0AAN6UWI0_9PEZI|nr:hypothetical protein B0J18DRAFT_442931 [Chaetomium sp. MPI-SDFR-AT-0129]KAK4140477.1 hypothetical protein C8A04DRAFT_39854 [Dichotomopilus funicola]
MRKRACDSCYQRKIQCDAASPRCDWCRHHDLPCTFNRPISTRRRGKAKKCVVANGRVRSLLAERAQAATDASTRPMLVFDNIPSPLPDQPINWAAPFTPSSAADTTSTTTYGTPDTSSLVTSPSYQLSDHFVDSPIRAESPAAAQGPVFGKLHFAGRHLGDISTHNGIPFLSAEGQKWVATRTGDNSPFQALAGPPSARARHALHPAFFCASTAHLSGRMELPERHVVEECLEMFANNPFKRIWPAIDAELFRQTIHVAYNEQVGRCSLESVAARACIFGFLALLALHHMYPKSMPSLDSEECAVQAQYLLPQSLYHFLLGQLQKAAVFHSVACRMMFTLGANTIVVPQLTSLADNTWRVKNQLRKLFWMIYCNDKEISLRTGQPPSINDDDCDLTLPQAYIDFKYVDDMPEFEHLLLDDTAVPLLPGDIRLDMIKSKTYTMLYSARAMRKTDAELLRDIRQLDDELEAWRLSVPPGFRPSLTMREEQTPELSEPRKMERIMIHVEMAVFYPISAIWTIFCNIMHNPLHPLADVDLELLNAAPLLIKEMRLRRLARDEMTHMKMVDDFAAELARLANRAVLKARQESM